MLRLVSAGFAAFGIAWCVALARPLSPLRRSVGRNAVRGHRTARAAAVVFAPGATAPWVAVAAYVFAADHPTVIAAIAAAGLAWLLAGVRPRTGAGS